MTAEQIDKEVDRLIELYCDIEDKWGSPYRYYSETVAENKARVKVFFKELVGAIRATTNLDELDANIVSILTDENFHTLCLALEIAKGNDTVENHLQHYAKE